MYMMMLNIGIIVGKYYSNIGFGINILCVFYDFDLFLFDFFIIIYFN